jgi:hypothetical protein
MEDIVINTIIAGLTAVTLVMFGYYLGSKSQRKKPFVKYNVIVQLTDDQSILIDGLVDGILAKCSKHMFTNISVQRESSGVIISSDSTDKLDIYKMKSLVSATKDVLGDRVKDLHAVLEDKDNNLYVECDFVDKGIPILY